VVKAAPREHSGRRRAMQMPDSVAEEMRAVAPQLKEQARRERVHRIGTANSRWRKAGHTVMAAGRLLGMRGAY
jgi:hypothetical protein